MAHPKASNFEDSHINYTPLLGVIFTAAFLVIGGMAYIIHTNNHISLVHQPLANMPAHILNDINQSHLWLEEVLQGDDKEGLQKIYDPLNNIKTNLATMEKMGYHSHLLLSHDELHQLSSLIINAKTTLNLLWQASETRLANAAQSTAGTSSDINYDAHFKQFSSEITRIGTLFNQSLQNHSRQLKLIETSSIIVSILITMAMTWFVLSIFRTQREEYAAIIKAESAQHNMEEKYRSLIEQSPLALQIMDVDGNVIQVNAAWEKLWEIRLNTLGQYNIFQDPHIKSSRINNDLHHAFAGKIISTQIFNLNPDNNALADSPFKSCFVNIHLYPVYNLEHEVTQVIMTFEDVTESHLQHIFQQKQNHVLGLISDPNVSLSTALEALVLAVETQIPQMMACILLCDSANTYITTHITPNLPPSYSDHLKDLSIAQKTDPCALAISAAQQIIVSDINKDSRWEKCKALAQACNLQAHWVQPIQDSDGKVLGVMSMYFKDVANPNEHHLTLLQNAAQLASNAIVQKQSMQLIISSEALLAEAQRLSHLGSWEFDLKSKSMICSHETYRIFGVDDNFTGNLYKLFLRAIHPNDRAKLKQQHINAVSSKSAYEITYRLMVHGIKKHVNSRCEIVCNTHGEVTKFTGTVQDVSQLMEAQKEKENVRSKMEHVQRLESLGVLAGGIAHDFNNILTAILGNAGLAANKLPQDSFVHDYIDRIIHSSRKAADLCKQMLAYSGKGRFIIKPIIISSLVEEMSNLLQVTIAKNIVLRLNLPLHIPAVEADVTQMQQVIMNLVINASEAIGKHSGSISVSTGLVSVDKDYLSSTFLDEELKEGLYVYLEVSDTGCGMSEETKNKIFEPFFTTKFTGRGLGMAAILGIVRGHKGAIKTYSELNKGSTFKILLPASKATPEHLALAEDVMKDWQLNGAVLIIDDEETIREVAVSMLADLNIKSMTAADGIEGVEVFTQHHKTIKVVILDMTMPRMGGEDTFTELCRIDPDVKVILSSGYNEQDATNRFAGKGLAGFLQKPYTPMELTNKLAHIFGNT